MASPAETVSVTFAKRFGFAGALSAWRFSTGKQTAMIGAQSCANRWEYSSENTRFQIDRPK